MAKTAPKRTLMRTAFLTGFLTLSSTAALVSLPIDANMSLQTRELNLPTPTADIIDPAELADIPETTTQWVEVKNGDNLGIIFERLGVGVTLAHQLVTSPNGDQFRKLRAGTHMEVQFNENNELISLHYHFSNLNIVTAERTDNGFAVEKVVKPVESRLMTFAGTIDNSLYIDGKKAGMQVQQIMDMADIFAWDIDFGREIQPGTAFNAVFEVPYADGNPVGSGKLVAARITIGKDDHTAFWHRAGGERAYFDKDGKSLRKAFSRNPVDYVRITSGFTHARLHPVLNTVRAHRGVDYGAPTGTPVHATGDGKISMRGWGNGYGNMVQVQHGKTYTTVYGHLSKFGSFKAGDSVKQGDVIGYVGMTGLASGPHLHYEFRINGQHVDPMGVKFPEATPIASKERPEFLKQASAMTELMNQEANAPLLAQAIDFE